MFKENNNDEDDDPLGFDCEDYAYFSLITTIGIIALSAWVYWIIDIQINGIH